MPQDEPDVIVVGAGNAGLCAAHAARERGARVLVLEKAPRRGRAATRPSPPGRSGSPTAASTTCGRCSRTTTRLAGDRPRPYTADDFLADMRARHARGAATRRWRAMLVDDSPRRRALAARAGHPLPAACTSASPTRSTAATGSGAACRRHRRRRRGADRAAPRGGGARRHRGPPRRRGRPTCCATRTASSRRRSPAGRTRREVRAPRGRARRRRLRGQPAMRAAYLGPELGRREGARHAVQHRRGAARGARARRAGRTATGAAATRSSGTRDAPPTGDRELTNRFSRQSYPVGIVVNRDGERFLDEGADFRNYTYAKYGAEVLRQPGGDRLPALRRSDRRGCCATIDYEAPGATRVDAATLGELAERLGHRPPSGLERTVARVQRRDRAPATFDPAVKDGKRTVGHRAAEVQLGAAARHAAVPRLPGHLRDHVHVRRPARRRRRRACSTPAGRPIPGLYAAGELVGGLFFHNYPGGSGLTAGAVFGRRAGYAAAERAAGR